jgi:dienelactone hydrolase
MNHLMPLFAVLCTVVFVASAQTPAETPLALDLHEEIQRTSVTVKDLYGRQETRQISITIFRPEGAGPFPFVIMNHGRAPQEKRALQGRQRYENLARYLVTKGFVVLVPTRVGYGENYGSFDPEDAGKNCRSLQIEHMATAASDQVLATLEFAKSLSYVDVAHWLVMGQSVGGLTTLATVWRNPPGLIAAINFSGGAGGNSETRPGNPCSPHLIQSLLKSKGEQAKVAMLWVYWDNDKYWGSEHPKDWFKAWTNAGAKAEFHGLPAVGNDGHQGLAIDMNHWTPVVDQFLIRYGFDASDVPLAPVPSGFAKIEEVDKVPVDQFKRENFYSRFLASKSPRAFVIGPTGSVGWATGDWAVGRALGSCQARRGLRCKLYAVDDEVVW